jgi:hypothetical protein
MADRDTLLMYLVKKGFRHPPVVTPIGQNKTWRGKNKSGNKKSSSPPK